MEAQQGYFNVYMNGRKKLSGKRSNRSEAAALSGVVEDKFAVLHSVRVMLGRVDALHR